MKKTLSKTNFSLKTFSLLIGALLCGSLARAAGPIVISDIDDTIKLAHIPSKLGTLTRGLDTESRFLGMAEFYQLIQFEQPETKFFYVSKAPEIIMKEVHGEFLRIGGFPEGTYKGFANKTSRSIHKVSVIREIIRNEKPEHLILIGDNGEQDSQVYQQIRREFPELRYTILIRQLYSLTPVDNDQQGNRIEEGQHPFITPIEASLILRQESVLSTQSTSILIQWLAPSLLKEVPFQSRGVLAFPSFIDCSNFQWPELDLSPIQEKKTLSLIYQVEEKVKRTCHSSQF